MREVRSQDNYVSEIQLKHRQGMSIWPSPSGERVYYESYLTQQIQKALCSQTAYLFLLELGNTITYSYSSTQAEPITEITFGPETCR
ncbi:hypothetical protein SAMN03159444_01277 [Pseudomonas sp. NFACC02]|nr:hypothetical protein SAMN03159444_01277 [Pseudomonas sp. NFACC02]